MKRVGIDIGSTTVKCVVLDEDCKILFKSYRRHMSCIQKITSDLLYEIAEEFKNEKMLLSMSGSAGMGIATDLSIPFVQEVYATRTAVNKLNKDTSCVIELGGEDAKILFLDNSLEVRMNGTCAGGTGAFIDQMVSLMHIKQEELNGYAENYEKIYTIASRCGVFAKTDIQPLINQGAKKEDIAASIFYAVVNQTIAGLSQGREIENNVIYLGGPLTFYPFLRYAFDDTLKLHGICPENSLYYVSIGSALSSYSECYDIYELAKKIENYKALSSYQSLHSLFSGEDEYKEFLEVHNKQKTKMLNKPAPEMYLGIDAGSTTIKALLCDEDGNVFNPLYTSNSGNPVPLIKKYLDDLYNEYPDINIIGSAVTGYGEDIIKNAFKIDLGLVETVAHFTSAKKYNENVDFIIDIGGQDIKCFKIRNGAIDSIFLNEACSSGCGSFLQTFAGALGLSSEEFSKKALFADKPVDLGSRCTVFMNSSIKQAQKDGASVENISAGLSISVVKNALYKVIRCSDSASLGKNIVVQGGTFNNDAVLRAFEMEIGHEVIRPDLAGLMGAYGAALYAKENLDKNHKSTVITKEELDKFTHEVKAVTCKGCTNHCKLTINTFMGNNRFIAGNRCEKPLKLEKETEKYNLFEYKNELLNEYRKNEIEKGKITIGIPMGLNMYELLPFWYRFFKTLGFNVIVSDNSSHTLYRKGQYSIPSDTVCYPAKLLHGHIENLIEKKPDIIFYPGMTYNVDEQKGKNHYNCPVVAYYPRVIKGNVKKLSDFIYFDDFISIHDKKEFVKHFRKIMEKYGFVYKKSVFNNATELAYGEYYDFLSRVRQKGEEYLEIAKSNNLPVTVLCGRPYHIDSEINHGIDTLICNLGSVVITEDSISHKVEKFSTTVLNQWTYHSRLYCAAKYVGESDYKNINLVQLVSFGCGVDAVTTDEVRAILESRNKLYTQIKIDEITNLGAVKIRLRSLYSIAKGK